MAGPHPTARPPTTSTGSGSAAAAPVPELPDGAGGATARRSRRARWRPVHRSVGLVVLFAVAVIAAMTATPTGRPDAAGPPPVAGAAAVTTAGLSSDVAVPAARLGAHPSGVPAEGPPVPVPPDTGGSCGITDVSACVGDAFTDMARSMIVNLLNPGLDLLGRTLLSTPRLTDMPRVGELWGMSWQLMLTIYGLLIVVGGLLVMVHQTVQTRTGLREVLPRLVLGFVAGAVSLPLCGMAIDIANAVSQAAVAGGVDPIAGAGGLRDLLTITLTGTLSTGASPIGLVFSLFVLPLVVMVLAVLSGWVLRVAVTVCLIAGAPLALMWHALPHTEGVARWWWRALAGCLATQILQALALIVALRIMLVPGSFFYIGGAIPLPTTAGLVGMLTSTVLLWILWKIPGWVWSSWIGGGGRGRSMLGTLVRGFLVAKGAGLLSAALSTRAARGTTSSGQAGQAGPSGPADPHALAPTGPGGQMQLPFGLTPRRPPPRRPRDLTQFRRRAADPSVSELPPREPWAGGHQPGDGQMGLPFLDDVSGDPQPVKGPSVGRRGWQWQLPIGDEPAEPPPWTQARAERLNNTYAPREGPLRGDLDGQWAMPIPENNPAFGARPVRGRTVGPDGWQWRLPIRPARATPPTTDTQVDEPAGDPFVGQYEIPMPAPRTRAARPRAGARRGPQPGAQRGPVRGPVRGPALDKDHPEVWQWRLPIPAGQIPRDRRATRFVPVPGYREPADAGRVPRDYIAGPRVADLPPRQPWAGGHRRGDGQYGLPIPPVRETPPGRLAHRFVPAPGRPEPADTGHVAADYVAHPQNDQRPRPVQPPPDPRQPKPPRSQSQSQSQSQASRRTPPPPPSVPPPPPRRPRRSRFEES